MEQKRLTIAIVAPFIYYPLTDGGRVSQLAMLEYLQHLHAITLIFTAGSPDCYTRIDEVKRMLPKVEVEVIHDLPVAPQKPFFTTMGKKATNRIRQIVVAKKREVPVSDLENTYLITVADVKKRSYIEQFTTIIRKKNYQLVQLDMHPLIDLVYCLPSTCKKLFVQHEIRFARLETYLAANHITAGAYEQYILSYVKSQEMHLLQQYDAVLTFSDVDRQQLLPALKEEKVMVSPFPVQENNFTPIDDGPYKANKLVFLGGSEHVPNKAAVAWFLDDAMNRIAQQYKLPLHIIGNWPLAERQEMLAKNPNVIFAGYVDDLTDYCKNSIMVVPIFVGSGIRTKILYAMAQGVPVISTSTGCEGIEVEEGKSILIADTAEAFVAKVGELLQHPDDAKTMILRAQEQMRRTYSQHAAGKRRSELYLQLVGDNAPVEKQV